MKAKALSAVVILPALCLAGLLGDDNSALKLRIGYERGFVDVLKHTIQFGKEGSRFDYVAEGGQDILFPFERLTAEVDLRNRHRFILLIQPLDVRTTALLDRDVVIDSLLFPAGTPMSLRYGFDFYRVSWLYDFWRSPERELACGLSLQLRNAAISFASQDGEYLRTNQNVGPVPIVKLRLQLPLTKRGWFGAEIDGFYAAGKVVTGSTNVTNDFIGAILDASVRGGWTFTRWLDGYLNLRYLGGGARGTSVDDPGPGDGYTDNWLNTASVTAGFYVH